MSIQHRDYTSKKTGKTTRKYFASVWYAEEGRSIVGPLRLKEKLAKMDETDILRSIEAGRAKATKEKRSIKIQAIFDLWHEATAPPTYAHNTWKIYERFYKDYIKDIFGDQAVSSVTPLHIQKYINLMKQKHSPETINKCINILTNLFNYAIAPLKCITSADNPMTGIKRCTVPRKQKVTWSDEEISYFLNLPEVMESHYYPMFCLSALLGPRPGEVCGLAENCLSTKPTYMISFDRGYNNYEYETNLKNNQSHRQPPIPQYLYSILHKRLLWKKENRLENPEWGNNDYFFVSQNGLPIKPKQYSVGFKRLLTAHNKAMEEYKAAHGKLPKNGQILPYITLYGFRTSFATNNMRRCPNAALISSVMGNSPKTLLQFYAQSDVGMQQELINNYVQLEKQPVKYNVMN